MENLESIIKDKKVLVGFDGYEDNIVKLVKKSNSANDKKYFETIGEFSNFIKDNSASCDIEMVKTNTKIGGNAPILANALSNFINDVTCIGMFGQINENSVFNNMNKNCKLINIGKQGYTIAFEFSDGKLMFGEVEDFYKLNRETFIERIGKQRLTDLINESDLICITNWSQFVYMNDILDEIEESILKKITRKNKIFFFDIADPLKRNEADLVELLQIATNYKKYGKVYIGLNNKEATIMTKMLCNENIIGEKNLSEILFKVVDMDGVVVHSKNFVSFTTINGTFEEKCFEIKEPKVITGSGDNFNCGFCLGLISNQEERDCVKIGISTASSYIENGYSVNLEKLQEFMIKNSIH